MILILGGTTEGRIAARTLEEAGKPFYYSTKEKKQEENYTLEKSSENDSSHTTLRLYHG